MRDGRRRLVLEIPTDPEKLAWLIERQQEGGLGVGRRSRSGGNRNNDGRRSRKPEPVRVGRLQADGSIRWEGPARLERRVGRVRKGGASCSAAEVSDDGVVVETFIVVLKPGIEQETVNRLRAMECVLAVRPVLDRRRKFGSGKSCRVPGMYCRVQARPGTRAAIRQCPGVMGFAGEGGWCS